MAKIAVSVLLTLSLAPLVAEAGRGGSGGGGNSGGGGGRLGSVSSGLGSATSGGGGGGGGGGGVRNDNDPSCCYDPRYYGDYGEPVAVVGVSGSRAAAAPEPPSSARVDFYAGAQKVHESDGSFSLELAFNQGRFRFGGSVSRYYERQEGRDTLTFTLPMLYMGWRIDDGGPTRAYLEVGAVGARTSHDPVMDSSVGGVFGGVRLEHRVSRKLAVVGDAQAMVFDQDVTAGAMRAGIKYGALQATFRYLDLNVGPALYGPEVGFSF